MAEPDSSIQHVTDAQQANSFAWPDEDCGQDWTDYPQVWPDWLESRRVPDAICAEAYEQAPAQARAAIKTALALGLAHFGENSGQTSADRHDIRHGIIARQAGRPADFALIVFAAGYRASARLAAACTPAILAGVQSIAAICLGGTPCNNALTTLELCGIEDIFAAEKSDLDRLLADLADLNGRIVLLGQDRLETGQDTAIACPEETPRLACFVERRRPKLRLATPEAFDRKILEFAQAGAIIDAENIAPDCPVDAIYCTPDQASHDFPAFSARRMPGYDQCLLLAPGCEGFWLHRGLVPEFFRVRQKFFALAD